MKRLVGSIYKLEMTPARGGPGTMRNGTVECLKARLSRRSYRRIISCDALQQLVSRNTLLRLERNNLPHQVPSVDHGLYSADCAAACWKLENSLRLPASPGLVHVEFLNGSVAAPCVDHVAVWAPASAHAPRRDASARNNTCNGIWHAPVPDANRAVHCRREKGSGGCL